MKFHQKNKGSQHLTVRKPVGDFDHNIVQLMLSIFGGLWWGVGAQNGWDGPEVATKEAELVQSMCHLQAIPNFHHELQPDLHNGEAPP